MTSWSLLTGADADAFDSAVMEYVSALAAREALDAVVDQAKKRVADLIPKGSDGANTSKSQAYYSTVHLVAIDEQKLVDIVGHVPGYIRRKLMLSQADLDRMAEAERKLIEPAIIRSEKRGPLFVTQTPKEKP